MAQQSVQHFKTPSQILYSMPGNSFKAGLYHSEVYQWTWYTDRQFRARVVCSYRVEKFIGYFDAPNITTLCRTLCLFFWPETSIWFQKNPTKHFKGTHKIEHSVVSFLPLRRAKPHLGSHFSEEIYPVSQEMFVWKYWSWFNGVWLYFNYEL